jgi:monofunctional biosynthetic peptidoglycan transglycosylase
MMKKPCVFRRLVFLAFLSSVVFVGFHFISPDVAKLKKENPGKTAFMEYREEEWAREGKKYRVQQTWLPYRAISPYLVKAVLIGEDDKFWQHEGFDYEAMQKAIEKDIKAKKFKLGGSTISQQLAKNLYLSPSKNPVRKLREAIITWRMERALGKKRILEIYLNVAEWGDRGIFGVEAAARSYYGKSASALGPEEAARLAAVLPNPRKFNPLGTSRYVVNRSSLIYNIMVRRGIVVPEYDEMEVEPSGGSRDRNDAQNTRIEAAQPSPQ